MLIYYKPTGELAWTVLLGGETPIATVAADGNVRIAATTGHRLTAQRRMSIARFAEKMVSGKIRELKEERRELQRKQRAQLAGAC